MVHASLDQQKLAGCPIRIMAPIDSIFSQAEETLARGTVRIMVLPPSRVGSSMVEQRPFKALVVGSSPTQPKPLNSRGEWLADWIVKLLTTLSCLRSQTQ